MRLRLPQRRERVLDLEGLTPLERASARFNASEAGRIVAGLVRTLGEPRVSVGTLAGSAEEMRVTVAWDLTWYQWAVAVGGSELPVRQIASGVDVTELDSAARQWNATTVDGGRIVLA
ncbi:MAG TPA: hypothetical protein VHR18_03460 [Solirubrobacterales bacterium]|nr:hypothetical protein [Solirubrobacterales bacterium]